MLLKKNSKIVAVTTLPKRHSLSKNPELKLYQQSLTCSVFDIIFVSKFGHSFKRHYKRVYTRRNRTHYSVIKLLFQINKIWAQSVMIMILHKKQNQSLEEKCLKSSVCEIYFLSFVSFTIKYKRFGVENIYIHTYIYL